MAGAETIVTGIAKLQAVAKIRTGAIAKTNLFFIIIPSFGIGYECL
jgi:hypothetical protein